MYKKGRENRAADMFGGIKKMNPCAKMSAESSNRILLTLNFVLEAVT